MQSLLPRFEYSFWGLKRQLCCLVVTVHIVLQERRVAITKNHLHFWWNFPTNHSHPHQKRLKWVQTWNKRIRFLLADDLSNILNFQINLFNFTLQSTSQIYSTYSQLTQNHHDLLSLQRWHPVDSRFWTRLCYYCSNWSRPKYNNQLTRNTPSSLAIALVSKTRLFEQSSSASSNYSQPRGKKWNERRSTLQCGGSRLGH